MENKKFNGRLLIIVLSLIVLIISGCGSGGGDSKTGEQPVDDLPVPPVVQAREEVVAEGEVVPAKSVELTFEQSGIVAEILVEEGSIVQAGTELARLDDRELVLAVEEAEANLAQAQADYDRLIEGATPEEVAIAEASLESAKASLASYEALVADSEASKQASEAQLNRSYAQLNQVQGQVTNSDIQAAQARVEQARLELLDLEDGPKTTAIQESQAALDSARASLQDTRDSLSAAKTNTQLRMETAANKLRDLQANYSGVYWDNREVERDWDSVNLDLPQKHKDREESALRAMKNAEVELEQAQVDYENARLAEITGIQNAEARVRELEARHTELINGADPDEIAAARAQLAQAEASLSQLQGLKRSGDIAAAQADISISQANTESADSRVTKAMSDLERASMDVVRAQADLDNVTADPRKSDSDQSLALIAQREVALKKAELMLEKSSLQAPFDGTVVEINPKEGEWFGTTQSAAVMADFSAWKIETTDLDELAVVNIDVGSLARISFDAIPDLELPGKVVKIQNLGKNYQGDIVYQVTIVPDQWDNRLRWNMTATVAIEPLDKEDDADSEDESGSR